MLDWYSANIVCTNCGHKEVIKIPKGWTIESIIHEQPCVNCGCETLEKVIEEQD